MPPRRGLKRPHYIAVRLTGDEIRKLRAIEEHMGLSRSDVIRLALRNLVINDVWQRRPEP